MIRNFRTLLICFSLLLTILSCKNEKIEVYSKTLGFIGKNDTLKIIVVFDDCGEWGGHKEYISLQRKENNKILAHYVVDSISCKNIISTNEFSELDENKRIVITDVRKELNKTDEKHIYEFIIRVFELYLRNGYQYLEENSPIYLDVGTHIQIINSNSSFNLRFENTDNAQNTYYGRVRRNVFGELIKK
jgi:hypothetical protein